MENAHKVWFMTGTSRGFGRLWAQAALERGDKVAAAARDTGSLTKLARLYGDNILPIRLDVSNKAAVDAAVARAHDYFGRLDVIVNNAGQGPFGSADAVTRAALPYLRGQGAGHIIQVSSGVNAYAIDGVYHELGIKVTVVEPTATGHTILSIVDADGPPQRIFFANRPLERAYGDAELAVQR